MGIVHAEHLSVIDKADFSFASHDSKKAKLDSFCACFSCTLVHS